MNEAADLAANDLLGVILIVALFVAAIWLGVAAPWRKKRDRQRR